MDMNWNQANFIIEGMFVEEKNHRWSDDALHFLLINKNTTSSANNN
jgi:hypothetical protein